MLCPNFTMTMRAKGRDQLPVTQVVRTIKTLSKYENTAANKVGTK